MEQIDSLLEDIRQHEERQLDRRTGVRDTALIWVYIMLGLALLVLCYSLFRIYRQLSTVIDNLTFERGRYRATALARKREIERRQRLEYYNQLLIKHLEERNEALDRYAYIASHDLKQPLRTISGAIDALLEDFPELAQGEVAEYMAMVSGGADRMQTMVSKLLDQSREDQHEEEFPIDLEALVQTLEADLAHLISECGATVVVEPLPFVRVPPVKMHTILQNLLTNAIKYAQTGRPPIVTIGAEAIALQVATGGEKPYRLYVRDNGRGISAENLERIGRFGERGASVDDDGHGIGLASVAAMLKSMDTELAIESTVGEGSTFSFRLLGIPPPKTAAPDVDLAAAPVVSPVAA